MRRIERQITEEWLLLILLDEGERVVREIVGDVSFAAHGLTVVLERRIEVFAPVAGGKPVVFIEPARVRVVRPLAAVVPFAEGARRVTRRLEGIGNRLLVEVHLLLPGRHTAHS